MLPAEADRPKPRTAPRARWLDRILLAAAVALLLGAFACGLATLAGALLLAGAAAGAAVATMRLRHFRLLVTAVHATEWERGEALASAARHAARWQAIVDTATEGIVTIDAAGLIESVNGAALRLFGYGSAELIGRNVAVLMPEPFHSEHDGYLRRYLTTGERRIIGIGREVVGRRQDGSEFPIDLSVGEGAIGGRRFFTAVIRDISERKEMQLKLAQSERLAAVGELAAGVAHEINNPINTVINCAQLIQDGDDARANCQVIQEEGARIADIVRDLLQFARDDRDRTQPTSLVEVIARTRRLLGENWQRHGIALHVDVHEDLPLVQARPNQLQQVLLNLLINAKDALLTSDGAPRCVWVDAKAIDHGVEFTVRDNGPGVPQQLGERIFEPFVTTKRGRGGTGLGLSISKSIVESYGGTIALQNEPGVGAAFRVWLPQASAE